MPGNIFRMVNEKIVRGKCLLAYHLRRGSYEIELTDIEVYEDGGIRWGWEMRVHSWEEFEKAVQRGEIITHLPENAEEIFSVRLYDLGIVEVKNALNFVDEEGLLKEVKDLLAAMRGQSTSAQRFGRVFDTFLKEPTPENREALKTAYLDVPEHHRRYLLGDQDAKDGPIRAILEKDVTEADLSRWRKRYLYPERKIIPGCIWME